MTMASIFPICVWTSGEMKAYAVEIIVKVNIRAELTKIFKLFRFREVLTKVIGKSDQFSTGKIFIVINDLDGFAYITFINIILIYLVI